jgi:hypothetical protein
MLNITTKERKFLFSLFMHDQREEVQKHNWIESEKMGKDVSVQAGLQWVCCYAKKFRDEWVSKYGDVV